MCETCGCGKPGEKAVIRIPGENMNEHEENMHDHGDGYFHSHSHSHGEEHEHHHHHHHHTGSDHSHDHDHEHNGTTGKIVSIETDILYANKLMAERNRGMFEAKKLSVFNLMSSPGSGKTTLLEKTINDLKKEIKFYVIEGDQQTMTDAERIKITGVPVIQVNTGNGCHLDAEMINRAVKRLNPEDGSVILIENVGNLVCPSLFDLGESKRVVVMSVTEGEDKPLKYPNMFRSSGLCIMNKTDLLPYLDYDVSRAIEYGHQVNAELKFIKTSAKTGEGMQDWYEWLKNNLD
jgi:hydrogenase nickel incorporation protein HypB